MIVLLLVFALLGILVSLLVHWFYTVFKFRQLWTIPGPTPLPILGNLLPGNPYDCLTRIHAYTKKYKGPFKIWTGPYLHVFITKPEHLEIIFTSNENINKSFGYDLFKPWLGEGLLILGGSTWKSRRKMLTTSFHFKILEEFMSVFNESSDKLVKKLGERVGLPETDIYEYVNLQSLDVICETSMGIKLNAQDDTNNEYVQAVVGLLNIMGERFFSLWKQSEFLYRQFADKREDYKRYLSIAQNLTRSVIQNKRAAGNNAADPQSKDDSFGIKKKVCLIDSLIEPTNGLTEDEIMSEINTFMFEGHDTTASALSFCLYNLAQNEDVQAKLYNEIIDTIGVENTTLTTQMLNELKYMDMVIKESQRMYTTVPSFERTVDAEFTMDGIKYPKNTILSLFIYGMHLNEELYPEPLRFDPTRFTPDNILKRHNFAYVPFSAGPRNCIGQKFALYEMKTVLVKVLQNYKLRPVPDHVLRIGFTGVIKCGNGIKVRLEKRIYADNQH